MEIEVEMETRMNFQDSTSITQGTVVPTLKLADENRFLLLDPEIWCPILLNRLDVRVGEIYQDVLP